MDETPRTDAMDARNKGVWMMCVGVATEFARGLERELIASNAALVDARNERDTYKHAVERIAQADKESAAL